MFKSVTYSILASEIAEHPAQWFAALEDAASTATKNGEALPKGMAVSCFALMLSDFITSESADAEECAYSVLRHAFEGCYNISFRVEVGDGKDTPALMLQVLRESARGYSFIELSRDADTELFPCYTVKGLAEL